MYQVYKVTLNQHNYRVFLEFSDDQCAKIPTWMKNDNRIFHGFDAPESIPWQAGLRIIGTTGVPAMCGGTILDR